MEFVYLFCELKFLWHNDNGDVQRATKETLKKQNKHLKKSIL